MKIGSIIQARTSSERLPGKVLLTLPYDSDITVLEQVVKRVSFSSRIDEVVIATSTDPSDQIIADLAAKKSYPVYRGSLHNVLERFHFTASKYSFDIIVRITGDCPCIDPKIIDLVIDHHLQSRADYTSCSFKRTFPHGIDVGVMNKKALEDAYENATSAYDKEHVTSFFYKTSPDNYSIQLVEAPDIYRKPEIRLTLDTTEDYILLCTIYDHLYSRDKLFGIGDILSFLQKKPWLMGINKQVKQKQKYYNISDELKDVLEYSKKQDLSTIHAYLSAHADKIKKWRS